MRKRYVRALFLLVIPFLLMILINEWMRTRTDSIGYRYAGVRTINSDRSVNDACTWACYRNTTYCLDHHVKYLSPYTSSTNRLYFGMIDSLKDGTGKVNRYYYWTNLLLLVVFVPLTIWAFLVGGLNIQDKIRAQRHSKN